MINILVLVSIAFATIVLAAETEGNNVETETIIRVKNRLLSMRDIPVLENVNPEHFKDATELVQETIGIINSFCPSVHDPRIYIDPGLPIPPRVFADSPIVTVQVEKCTFTAHYFFKSDILFCGIIGAQGQLIALIAFSTNANIRAYASNMQTLKQKISDPSSWFQNYEPPNSHCPEDLKQQFISRIEASLTSTYCTSIQTHSKMQKTIEDLLEKSRKLFTPKETKDPNVTTEVKDAFDSR